VDGTALFGRGSGSAVGFCYVEGQQADGTAVCAPDQREVGGALYATFKPSFVT
jgi:hypothetical protein